MGRILEPFFTTKPEGQGSGLGLSMVYGFVKQSAGHLKLYSEVGHGTTVRIYLPRVKLEEDIVTTESNASPVTGGTETILVAEDDEDVRNTAVALLQDLGYRVLTARDAAAALAIMESGVPLDLLFTDVVMPGSLRSTELARMARERLPQLAVLFTSGYTENAVVHAGKLDDGVELLSKPYSREALARKIRHVLHNQHQRDASHKILFERVHTSLAVSPGIKPLRVLLVEDDDLVRAGTLEMLRNLGLDTEEAVDGASALQTLERETFDVLFADMGLPDISGIDLAIRATRICPRLRVIVASGADVVLSVEQRVSLPNAVTLRKPYDAEDLCRMLGIRL
jgi:CheY-like chemotaxis protein